MNQRKAGMILSYIYIIISNSISLIYTPFMLRIMGQSEYGLNGTAASFVGYLSLLSFGIGGAYIRFNSKYRVNNDREGEKRLNGMFLIIFAGLSVLVIIGGAILVAVAKYLTKNSFTPEETYKLRILIILLTGNAVVTFLFNVVMMALQSYEKFIFIRVVQIIACLINPMINIAALKMGGRAITITAISLTISVISYLVYYIYARLNIGFAFIFSGFDKNEIKEIFVFSSFLFIDSVTNQISKSTDTVILGIVHGTAMVAVYTIGVSFVNYYSLCSGTVSSVFASKVNQLVAKKADIKELDAIFLKVGRIQFFIVSLILLGFTLIGQEFINIWAGPDYSNAYWIALLLLCASFVPSFQNVGIEIQKAYNKHRARSIVYMLVAVVNIILTVPFAIKWGGIGATIATFLCVVLGQVIWMNWYYASRIHLNIIGFWKSILSTIPGFVPAIIGGIIYKRIIVIDSLWDIMIGAIVITIFYLLGHFMLSLNDYEKQLVIVPVKKILKRII